MSTPIGLLFLFSFNNFFFYFYFILFLYYYYNSLCLVWGDFFFFSLKFLKNKISFEFWFFSLFLVFKKMLITSSINHTLIHNHITCSQFNTSPSQSSITCSRVSHKLIHAQLATYTQPQSQFIIYK